MSNTRNYFRLLSIIIVMLVFLPVVSRNMPTGLGSLRYFWAPIWFISLLFLRGRVFSHKAVFPFLIYGMFFFICGRFLWVNMDSWFFYSNLWELYNSVTALSILVYFYMERDFYGLAIISALSLLFFIITAVLSNYVLSIDPMFSRMISGGDKMRNYIASSHGSPLFRLGCGDYSFGQSLVVLLPIMIFYLKNSKLYRINKNAIIILILLFYITIVRMQFFANIITSTLIVLLAFFSNKENTKKNIIIFAIFALVTFSIPNDIYINLLVKTSSLFSEDSSNYSKLIDMKIFLEGGGALDNETGAGARASEYPILLKTFIKSPLFGNAYLNKSDDILMGYHLHWMSKLTAVGLFGFIIYIMTHIVFFSKIFTRFSNSYASYAILSYFSFYILGLQKTLSGEQIWYMFFLIIPSLYFFPQYKKIVRNDI